MLRFIRYKIKNKKLLNSSLLIGVSLLVAFLCIYPMFREGSLNKLLQTLFTESAADNGYFPVVASRRGSVTKDDFVSVDAVIEEMEKYKDTWVEYLDCPMVEQQQVLSIRIGNADTSFGSKSRNITIGYMPDIYEHANLLYGCRAEDAATQGNELVKKALAQGAYPCVVSQILMDRYEVVVGETFSFKFSLYNDEPMKTLVITGIIDEKPEAGNFWYNRMSFYKDSVFLSKDVFEELVTDNAISEIACDEAVMLDYTQIDCEQVEDCLYYLNEFKKLDSKFVNNFEDILRTYCEQEKTISVMLFTFELPIIALLLLFLYMISGRILEMETTEISMLKSRGISRGKVIRVYILQSSIIAFAGCIVGLPMGILLCRLAAGTNAFLSFSFKDVSIYKPTVMMLLFALIAFVLAVMFMTLPVISLSKLTITERRTRKLSTKAKPFWEKYFVDVLLLVVSGYLLYNNNRQKAVIAAEIIGGGETDPVIFLNSSLFILSCGLVFLRLIGYLVRLIYHIGRKHWQPASYVAFLQIIRSAKKQGFISVFIVMTISMGVFNANLARTVNENMERRTAYNAGADMIVQQKWELVTIPQNPGDDIWYYKEPDFEKFNILKDCGVDNMTKVIVDNNCDIVVGSKVEKGHTMMAVSPKNFGETVQLNPNLNDMHWYNYLNALSANPKGILVSTNYATKYDLVEGDQVTYERYSPVDPTKTYAKTTGTIVGIVDAFPGYQNTTYITNADGSIIEHENYLIVTNYSTAVNAFQKTPYQVWMHFSEKVDGKVILQTLEDKGIEIKSSSECAAQIQKQRDSAMIQITNGMFSIGFVISLLICGVGFLIYWVLTIKEREMIYGIYRAMGMSMKEIVKILVTEQVFGSLLAALSGFGVGAITTFLFTRLIAIVYLPRKHNLPIDIYIQIGDAVKVVAIFAAAFAICFFIMRRTVKNMSITKALKMGED